MGCDVVESVNSVLALTNSIVKIFEVEDGEKSKCGITEWTDRLSRLGSYNFQKFNAHTLARPVEG